MTADNHNSKMQTEYSKRNHHNPKRDDNTTKQYHLKKALYHLECAENDMTGVNTPVHRLRAGMRKVKRTLRVYEDE